MRQNPCSYAAFALLLTAPACARPRASQYVSSACPIPGELRGYPVSASSDAALDTALLGRVARAMAASYSAQRQEADRREPVPTVATLMADTLDRGEIFERHSWRPEPGDTARLRVTYRAGQSAPEVTLANAGDPTPFAASVRRAALAAVENARERPGARHALPLALETPDAEPVVIDVAFGREAGAPGTDARFSVHEGPVLPLPSNIGPVYPTNARAAGIEGDVRIAFIVRPDSTADLSSVRVLESTRPDFATAVVHSLARARFVPAEIDCRLVPTVVVQPFSFRMNHQLLSDH